MKGFIVYPTYHTEHGKSLVYLFGRLENGQSFLTINEFKPYFYIRTHDIKKAKKINNHAFYENTDFTTFTGENVTKIVLESPKDVAPFRNMLLEEGISCYEADIRFPYRFLIDHDIRGSLEIDGDYELSESIDRIYHNPTLKPANYFPKLKVLSFDIETDKHAGDLYAISVYTESFQKVFLVKKGGKYKNAECFATEEEVLERFMNIVKELDPDVIVGWNVIDFDLNYLQKKYKEYHIPFLFGRVPWPCKLRISESFFRDSSADIPGRMVLDGIHLLKMSFIKMDNYKLDTAAQTFLGEKKLIEGPKKYEQIDDAYNNNPQKLVDYNLKDAELAYNIIFKTDALSLTIRRSLLTRMQLDRVNASIASFDALYLRELQKRKLVAPTAVILDRDERIVGGFVRDPKPGIYENSIIVDFKSLYPSIMRTFNIDPVTFVGKQEAKKYNKEELIEAPNGAYFKREEGILPQLIQQLWLERDAAKKRKDQLSSHAIKILMNSFFGIAANPTFRFYSLDMSNAITHFGRLIIQTCAEEIQKRGYDVIYGDTDSLFIDPKLKHYDDAVALGKKLQHDMTYFFKTFVKKEYNRESYLELEFDKVYKKLLLPKVRKSEVGEGAKKRYSGLLIEDGKEEVEFVGLESVRRDWTDAAQKFQRELYWKIFHEENPTLFIKEFVNDLKSGKYDSMLVYRKGIRKSVDAYTKTTPPHIKAARKAGIEKVGIMEYYMTVDGPEAVGFQKNKLDYDHYVEKQIKPIAEAVLTFFHVSFDDLLKTHKQISLNDF
ncbi:MAG: DNA polymerase II [Nanoarchaeota archaeon]